MLRAAYVATAALIVLLSAVQARTAWPAADEKPAAAKKADHFDVQDKLTDQDPLDKVKTKSHCKIYPLKMSPKRAYTIDLRSSDFDAYLRIEDANGKSLAEDDDGGDGTNARLVFVPPSAGTYKIIATTFEANETGAFTLEIRSAPVLLAVQGQLTNNDPLDKLRKGNHHKVHTFKMVPGRTYTIDLRSSDFDAYLRLEDSKQANLAEDDDSGDGTNARLVFTPTKEDTYRVIVTTFQANETGTYMLTITEKKD
jgi:hypothetical protein